MDKQTDGKASQGPFFVGPLPQGDLLSKVNLLYLSSAGHCKLTHREQDSSLAIRVANQVRQRIWRRANKTTHLDRFVWVFEGDFCCLETHYIRVCCCWWKATVPIPTPSQVISGIPTKLSRADAQRDYQDHIRDFQSP